MFARKPIAIAIAMLISVFSGGFVATSSAQAADDCQVTITGGDVTALSGELTNGSSIVICVSGTFEFSGPISSASRSSLTFRGDETATFKLVGDGWTGQTLLDVSNQNGASNISNLFISGIIFDGSSKNAQAIKGQSVEISNSSFKNFALGGGYGAAVYTYFNLKVDDSDFAQNSVTQGYGGALAINVDQTATISNTTFTSNFASDGGGAVHGNNRSTVTISNSTFSGNSTNELGGAIYVQQGILNTSNSTFTRNQSIEGGAIFTHGGEVKFSTFLDNLAATPSQGNDIPGNSIYYGTLTSQKTPESEQTVCSPDLNVGANIFANSSAHPEIGIGGVLCTQKVTDIGSNIFSTQSEPDLISAGSLSFANASIFGKTVTEIFGSPTPPLADNGGSTKTIALTSGSPAIDFAASGGISANAVAKDQRGFDRIGASDAGAYEFGAVAAVVTPPTQNSTPTTETSTASSATSATTTKTLAATGSSSSTWGLSALAGLITALGVASLRSASRSSKN